MFNEKEIRQFNTFQMFVEVVFSIYTFSGFFMEI